MIYRGYTIDVDANSQRFWVDERNFRHGPFASEDDALSDVDAYRRNLRSAQPGKSFDHAYERGAYGVCKRCGENRHS